MSKRSAALRYYRSYRPESKLRRAIRRVIRFLLLLFIAKIILTSFLLSSYVVRTEAMEPSLKKGERVLATPLLYGGFIPFTAMRFPAIRLPNYGEMVLYQTPVSEINPWWINIISELWFFITGEQSHRLPFSEVPVDARLAIGRIIAKPGDTVRIDHGIIMVKKKGESDFFEEHTAIRKEYRTQHQLLPEGWDRNLPFSNEMDALTLGDEDFFIVNDNRTIFSDSRLWGVQKAPLIQAKVLFSYWPRFSFH
ncbi:signal peptidase I [Sediminispirochaeta smaragdinae]|nr:signal peptidase I [Sediminispirochaeta smaragdinae]